jgi:hypothetical protein
MARKKIYFLSLASTIAALLATLLIASNLSSIQAVDRYALVQTAAMLSAFWVTTRIDYETHTIKSNGEKIKFSKIPFSYYLFALLGVASLYLIMGHDEGVTLTYLLFVVLYPLIFYKNEYLVIASMSEGGLNSVYISRIIKQILPATLAILTGSVDWTLVGTLLGLLASSIYLQVRLKHKINWVYINLCRDKKVPLELEPYRIGIAIAGGLAAMWYFERFSLFSIEPGLVSIAYFSLQITNTVAVLLAGTLATLQFNNSENSLGVLKRYWLTIVSCNFVLMGLAYLLIKLIYALLEFALIKNELLLHVGNNINFFAIYLMASIPTTTALFIGRMYVASGSFDSMMRFYVASLPVHFGFIGAGLITQNVELLAMHFFMGNSLYITLALLHKNPKKAPT